jgi:hypothetical protein
MAKYMAQKYIYSLVQYEAGEEMDAEPDSVEYWGV